MYMIKLINLYKKINIESANIRNEHEQLKLRIIIFISSNLKKKTNLLRLVSFRKASNFRNDGTRNVDIRADG